MPKNRTECTNFYNFTKKEEEHNPRYKDHLIKIPFRMGIIGSSGSGKTLLLCELISRMNNTFEEIIICLRSKDEPLYRYLEDKGKGLIVFHEGTIPPIDEFKEERKQRLIVFDDLILDKALQSVIGEYMIRSRKYNISCCYLSQSFYQIPKIIRQQLNYLVLKKLGSDKDIKFIIRDYALGLDISDLMKLYKMCTTDKLHFLMMDLQGPEEHRWRLCFEPIQLPKFMCTNI